MQHHHSLIFVGLSVGVAIAGSWTALDLFERVRIQAGRARLTWLIIVSLVMGVSIWSMHFIAMLGFDPGSPVGYDPGLTAGSLVLAVGGTAAAFFMAVMGSGGAARLLAAGAAMGLSICAMHYVGMAALRTAASLGYRPQYVLASIAIAIAASTAALWAARRRRSLLWRSVAAVILGLAIVGMHYTAMAALVLTPTGLPGAPPGTDPVVLAVAIAAGTGLAVLTVLAASLLDERQALLSVLDAGDVGYWEVDFRTGRLQASERTKRLLGLDPAAPMSQDVWRSTLSPDAQLRQDEMLDIARSSGRTYRAEYRLRNGRWAGLRGRVVRDRRGRALRIAGVLLDLTDREESLQALEESQRQQQLLINELNHRVKNTLATIQAVAALSARRATSMPAFVDSFQARIVALSKTQDLLTAQGWEKADVRQLLEAELSPYASDQVRLRGPAVSMASEHALALGMIFHELATNAAKYGGLSAPGGRLDVEWVQSGDTITLDWVERGGPPVKPVSRTGFGSELIAKSLRGKLQGEFAASYLADGFRCRLSACTGSKTTAAP
ncbi:hypothetical protein E4M02_06065 [Brevundimonas sp. S30B]|uniref:MHYT domain-containing protein n=1 Tax=unclassified Brevundimonas TaxID=2622653 RepID=UPI00107182A6|nr:MULTISPECIES: MHYT domain-containing protein [unclassified Brevundimonas]QBX38080.1 hypothetical protein E4M01_10075 [Brevundimonas sp. MF30-B]TFW02566.1 hypothetical protein E4M02_06065 [Brevundimonas sp. S30B]